MKIHLQKSLSVFFSVCLHVLVLSLIYVTCSLGEIPVTPCTEQTHGGQGNMQISSMLCLYICTYRGVAKAWAQNLASISQYNIYSDDRVWVFICFLKCP